MTNTTKEDTTKEGCALDLESEESNFGPWLRRQRRLRDLTQEAAGAEIGCTASMLKKIEAGSRLPSAQLRDRAYAWAAENPVGGPTAVGFEPGEFLVLVATRVADEITVTVGKNLQTELKTLRAIKASTALSSLTVAGEGGDSGEGGEPAARALHIGVVSSSGLIDNLTKAVEEMARASRPGRTVVSNAARHLLESTESGFRPYGRISINGQREALYELHDGGADQPRSSEGMVGLPTTTGPLVGRDQALSALSSLLTNGDRTVVTLTGPGGTGKTRLAVEVGRAIVDSFLDGAVFVDLGDVRAVSECETAIARAFDVGLDDASPAMDQITAALRSTRAICILDNLEQVKTIAPTLSRLAATTDLRILATSRFPLGIRAEQEFPVPPLAVGDAGADTSTSPAVTLLMHCTEAIGISPIDPEGARELCRVLDGLPLAIEMAAPRLVAISPLGLAEVLRQRLDLIDTSYGVPERQKSLAATIDWSVSLLTNQARTVFRCLAVFEGSWDLAGLSAVLAGSRDAQHFEVQVLASAIGELNRVHLIRSSPLIIAGQQRYTMYQTVRSFAADMILDNGLRGAHAAHYLDFAFQLGDRTRTGDDTAFSLLQTDFANIRAAIVHAQQVEGASLFSQGATTLGNCLLFWLSSGRLHEARQLAQPFLDHRDRLETRARAILLYAVGTLLGMQGDTLAYDLLDESLVGFEALGDARWQGNVAANLGAIALHNGDFERARQATTASLELRRSIADERGVAISLGNLGSIERQNGNLKAARIHLAASAAAHRTNEDQRLLAAALLELASVQMGLDDLASTEVTLREALQIGLAVRNMAELPFAIERVAELILKRRLRSKIAEQAARLLGASAAMLARTGVSAEVDQVGIRVELRALRVLTKDRWDLSIREGRLLSVEGAVDEAQRALHGSGTDTNLTTAELAVLRLAADGFTNDQIARNLHTSTATTRRHLQTIFVKLGVTNRAAAVRSATFSDLL